MMNKAVTRVTRCKDKPDMGLILLEAFGALALLVFFVWWTMFSGRRGGERADHASSQDQAPGKRPGSED